MKGIRRRGKRTEIDVVALEEGEPHWLNPDAQAEVVLARLRKRGVREAKRRGKAWREGNPPPDELKRALARKHMGPGPHPGTGTAQAVHGKNRGVPTLIDRMAKGGFTWRPATATTPTTGKVVSIYPENERRYPGKRLNAKQVKDYLRENHDLLKRDAHYLGGWVDKGESFLDVSILVDTHERARVLAVQHDQRAYFDLDTMEEIRVDESSKSDEEDVMPVKPCESGGKKGWKFGDSGKCYTGPGAKRRAIAQGVAISMEKQRQGKNPEEVAKHMGPGAHPSGTSQDVHGHGEGGGPPTGEDVSQAIDRLIDTATYRKLKARWARVNNALLTSIERPDSPEAIAAMKEMKKIVKQMHRLDVDTGGVEGVGLPGGPRDIVIIGGGPSGLAAAVMGGTDGLDTLLVEQNPEVGGQARFSSRIENLPGFPIGVSGETLAQDMHEQAERVGAEVMLSTEVTGITHDPKTGLKTVTFANGDTVEARSVLLTGGLEFRRLDFEGSDSDRVIYGDGKKVTEAARGGTAVIIGGSNGAAQAALGAATQAKQVYVLSRSPITKGMSDYQVSALRNHDRVTVIENDVIASLSGRVATTRGGQTINLDALGVFAGSVPDTDWLPSTIERDSRGRVIVNSNHSTSIPGIFAAGDVRQGAIGRVGSSIGEGQLAQRNAWIYIHENPEKRREKAEAKRTRVRGKRLPRATPKQRRQYDRILDEAFRVDLANPFLGETAEPVTAKPRKKKKSDDEFMLRECEAAIDELTDQEVIDFLARHPNEMLALLAEDEEDRVPIKKVDAKQQKLWAEVYVPGFPDTHGAGMTADEIERMAHRFLAEGRVRRINVGHGCTHDVNDPCDCGLGSVVIESFVAGKDSSDWTPGAWVVGMHVPDPALWRQIERGELNGLSMEALVLMRDSEVEVTFPDDGVVRGDTRLTTSQHPHEHEYVARFDEQGNLVSGETVSTSDGPHHTHRIKTFSFTEESGEHGHRFSIMDALRAMGLGL